MLYSCTLSIITTFLISVPEVVALERIRLGLRLFHLLDIHRRLLMLSDASLSILPSVRDDQ